MIFFVVLSIHTKSNFVKIRILSIVALLLVFSWVDAQKINPADLRTLKSKEDSLKHLRQRRTEAEEQLKPAAGPPAPCGPPGGSDRPRQIGVAWARGTWSQLGVVGSSEWFRMQP